MNTQARLGLLYATIAYVSWGLLGPIGKTLLEAGVPVMTVNAVRMLAATALLFPFLPREVLREGIRYLRRWRVMLVVLVGGGIDFTIYMWSLALTDPAFVAIGFYTAPFWTALLARPWLGERVGWSFVPAVLIMLVGGWFAVGGGWSWGGELAKGFHAGGMVLAVLTGLGWAVYAVGLRVYAPNLRLRPLMVASFLVWLAYFVVLALIVDGPSRIAATLGGMSGSSWLWIIFYGLGPTVLSMLLYNAALQRAAASHVNILVGVEVAATLFFAWLLLGDRFTVGQLAGVGLVVLAVTAYLWREGRRFAAALPGGP